MWFETVISHPLSDFLWVLSLFWRWAKYFLGIVCESEMEFVGSPRIYKFIQVKRTHFICGLNGIFMMIYV